MADGSNRIEIRLFLIFFRVGETPKYRKDDEDKFKVDKNLNGLWQYLTKRNIDMETFAELLVKGKNLF